MSEWRITVKTKSVKMLWEWLTSGCSDVVTHAGEALTPEGKPQFYHLLEGWEFQKQKVSVCSALGWILDHLGPPPKGPGYLRPLPAPNVSACTLWLLHTSFDTCQYSCPYSRPCFSHKFSVKLTFCFHVLIFWTTFKLGIKEKMFLISKEIDAR